MQVHISGVDSWLLRLLYLWPWNSISSQQLERRHNKKIVFHPIKQRCPAIYNLVHENTSTGVGEGEMFDRPKYTSVWLSGRRQSHRLAPQPEGLTGGYIYS